MGAFTYHEKFNEMEIYSFDKHLGIAVTILGTGDAAKNKSMFLPLKELHSSISYNILTWLSVLGVTFFPPLFIRPML